MPFPVTFPSLDGLDISADLYLTSDDRATPFIVLFHEAGSSRGEYRDIAPRLNALGYNVMAVDQRAGGSANDVKNETFTRAVAAGLPTDFLDA